MMASELTIVFPHRFPQVPYLCFACNNRDFRDVNFEVHPRQTVFVLGGHINTYRPPSPRCMSLIPRRIPSFHLFKELISIRPWSSIRLVPRLSGKNGFLLKVLTIFLLCLLGRKGDGWRTSRVHMSARIRETRNMVDGGLTTSNNSPKTMLRRGKSIASIRRHPSRCSVYLGVPSGADN